MNKTDQNKLSYINIFNDIVLGLAFITGVLSAAIIGSFAFEGILTPLAFSLAAPCVVLFFNMLLILIGNSRFIHTLVCIMIFFACSFITVFSGGEVHKFHSEINLYFGVCWLLLLAVSAISDMYTMEISNTVIHYVRGLRDINNSKPNYFAPNQKRMISKMSNAIYDVPSSPSKTDLLSLSLRTPSVNYFKRVGYFNKHCHQASHAIHLRA